MPTPLVAQHYPDDFQILTYSFTSAPADTVLLYADRPLIIDSIVVGVTSAASAGTGATLSFEVTQDCTSMGSSQIIAVADVGNSNATAGDTIILDGQNNSSGNVRRIGKTGTAASATGSTQLTWIKGTNTTIDNTIPMTLDSVKVPVGYYLVMDVTSVAGFNGFIQLRFRSRQA